VSTGKREKCPACGSKMGEYTHLNDKSPYIFLGKCTKKRCEMTYSYVDMQMKRKLLKKEESPNDSNA
jgi:hypothetical protein